MEITTIGNIAVSALYELGRPTGGADYTWLKQQAIEYARGRMQQNLVFNIVCDYVQLSPSNKVYTFPNDCLTVNKVGYIHGNKIYPLGVDNTLALPSSVEFECSGFPSGSSEVNDYIWTPFYGIAQNFTQELEFSPNYYRIEGRKIIFSNDIPNGKLAVEYFSTSGIDENTVIDPVYARLFKLWLLRQWSIKNDRSMVSFYTTEYVVEESGANSLAYNIDLEVLANTLRASTGLNLA